MSAAGAQLSWLDHVQIPCWKVESLTPFSGTCQTFDTYQHHILLSHFWGAPGPAWVPFRTQHCNTDMEK